MGQDVSTVSAVAEHLIRAAIKGIRKNPDNWHQGSWVTPNTECGTSYCIGGWMLLYDGWAHAKSEGPGYGWSKGDRTITDPYAQYLECLVYGDEGFPNFSQSIFDTTIRRIDDLVNRIEDQLEINFEEQCPCLFESGLCNLQGCPCGTHREVALSMERDSDVPEDVIKAAAQLYVQISRNRGKFSTVELVLNDMAAMAAFRAVFQAGAHSTVLEVTNKAQRRIAEINHKLQQVEKERDDLTAEVARLRAEPKVDEYGDRIEPEAPWERDLVIRSLQGRIDDLRDGTRRTPEYRKMKASLREALAKQEGDRLKIVEQSRAITQLSGELTKQKRVVKELQSGFSRNLTTSIAVIENAIKTIKGES